MGLGVPGASRLISLAMAVGFVMACGVTMTRTASTPGIIEDDLGRLGDELGFGIAQDIHGIAVRPERRQALVELGERLPRQAGEAAALAR